MAVLLLWVVVVLVMVTATASAAASAGRQLNLPKGLLVLLLKKLLLVL